MLNYWLPMGFGDQVNKQKLLYIGVGEQNFCNNQSKLQNEINIFFNSQLVKFIYIKNKFFCKQVKNRQSFTLINQHKSIKNYSINILISYFNIFFTKLNNTKKINLHKNILQFIFKQRIKKQLKYQNPTLILILAMISQKQAKEQAQIRRILFQSRDITQIDDFLSQHQDLDPSKILDDSQNNVLHQLAYQDHLDIIKLYVHHSIKLQRKIVSVKKGLDKIYQKDYKQQIIHWFNKKNKEGFTPFLYAAYMGNLETVKYFHVEGANIYAQTKTGLNVFHLAAQNDKVNIFLYFKDKISLNSLDNTKSTPLHWAAYANSQTVCEYILASNQVDLDVKDDKGQTCLHIATMYGNTRIVRRLLLKGANRYLKNAQKKTPQKIAQQSNFRTIKKMLNQNFSLLDFLKLYCNIKIEYRPKKKGFLLPLVLWASIAISLISINTIMDYTNDYAFSFQVVLFSLLFAFYISLLIPYSKPQPQTYQQLLYAVNTDKICFQCVRKKPKRSNHCQRCQVCIPQFDHHCTWIRNCVGKHNLARFVIFVFLLVIAMGFIGVISVFGLLQIFLNDDSIYKFWFEFRFKQLSDLQRLCSIFLLAINVLMSLFIFPVFGLLMVQLKNLFTNKTTYEKLKAKIIPEKELVRDKLKKGREISYWKNCKIMCSSNDSFISTQPTLKSQVSSLQQPLQ